MTSTDTHAIRIELDIAATPDIVYRHFADPSLLSLWFEAGARLEVRVGGTLRIGYPSGQINIGRVIAVEPGRMLEFTWSFAPPRPADYPEHTRVVVRMDPIPGGTRLTLTHDLLPSATWAQGSRSGWNHYLGRLASAFAPSPATSGEAS